MSSMVNPVILRSNQEEERQRLEAGKQNANGVSAVENSSSLSNQKHILDHDFESPLNSIYNCGNGAAKSFGNHWETFIVDENQGHVFVASSNYEGDRWDGFVSRFNSLQDTSCIAINPGQSGCSELVKGPDDTLLGGFDTGYLLVFNKALKALHSFPAHESIITGVKILNGSKTALTASIDASIRFWDLETLVARQKFDYAHAGPVWSVDPHPSNHSVFLSCGQDGNLLSWDIRTEKPAVILAKIESSSPSSCVWSKAEEQFVYCGTKGGHVSSFDQRKPGLDISTRLVSAERIHRLRLVCSGHLAVVSDSCILSVVKEQTLETLYEGSARHMDIIRDAKEIEGKLISVGSSCVEFVEHHLTLQ